MTTFGSPEPIEPDDDRPINEQILNELKKLNRNITHLDRTLTQMNRAERRGR